ncbi:hypothetical protein LINPERHAP2_LOCUS6439 [Linum perenne]
MPFKPLLSLNSVPSSCSLPPKMPSSSLRSRSESVKENMEHLSKLSLTYSEDVKGLCYVSKYSKSTPPPYQKILGLLGCCVKLDPFNCICFLCGNDQQRRLAFGASLFHPFQRDNLQGFEKKNRQNVVRNKLMKPNRDSCLAYTERG